MTTLQAPPPTTHELLEQTWHIIATVDARASDCNRRWGTNRLPHLVPIEWMEKFRSQRIKWNRACLDAAAFPTEDDVALVRRHGEAMLRAFDMLERMAGDAGHFPGPAEHWEFELSDGTPVLLVRDRAEMGQVDAKGRSVQIWSLEEVADIIAKFPALVKTKEAFPGAEVVQMRTDKVVIGKLDDSLAGLPF